MLKQFIQGTPPFVIHSFNIVTPGSEIPKWFNDRTVGDSVVVKLPFNVHPTRSKLKGYALCAVFAPQENPTAPELDCLGCDACGIKCFSRVGRSKTSLLVKGIYYKAGQVQSDHLWLLYLSFKGYDPNNYWKGAFRKFEFSFKTFCSRGETKKCLKLKKCGVRLVTEQDAQDLNDPYESISLYKPIDNSADVQSSISMEKITEHFDGAGSSESSSIPATESLQKGLKYD
ncbi:hypothetical protein COP2_034944 [Malus domestica]